MTALTIATDRTSSMARVNPVAKLGASLAIGAVLLLTVDVVSASVALALELLLLPWAGLGVGSFLRRTSALWIAAPLAAGTTALYGVDSGATLWGWGFISVAEGSVDLGLAIGLRVLAAGIPAIVLFVTTDPTDLADGLTQVLRMPERFVLGALAGLRLVGLSLEDWRTLGLSRRARGVADGGRLRRFAGQAFALLVLALRRATKLAVAMEARGFGMPGRRSWARESTFGGREVALVLVGVAIAIAAASAAIATGSWRWVLA